MSKIILKYEILVSGLYPFNGVLEKNGFTLKQNTIDQQKFETIMELGLIYISPYLGFCTYPNHNEIPVFLTFEKESIIDIDYSNHNEFDIAFTSEYLHGLDLFQEIETLEKIMTLELNNNIKFPIKLIKVYDTNNNFVTLLADFTNPNVPTLLSHDTANAIETINRQNNRLTSGFAYDKITELSNKNKYFRNALSFYYSSFSVVDKNVSFILLITALESLLNLSTYSDPETCSLCGQKKYQITETISKNVSLILMDTDNSIYNSVRNFYKKRSKCVHSGDKLISNEDIQILQEYVRKVLLMYWYLSMCLKTEKHKDLIKIFLSEDYTKNYFYKSFLECLSNTSFEEKKTKIIETFIRNILQSKKQ